MGDDKKMKLKISILHSKFFRIILYSAILAVTFYLLRITYPTIFEKRFPGNKIIVMKYIPGRELEEIRTLEIYNEFFQDKYRFQDKFVIHPIKFHNRYMRYINCEGKLFYIRRPERFELKTFLDRWKYKSLNSWDDSKDIGVNLESLNLRSGKKEVIFPIHLNNVNLCWSIEVSPSFPPTEIFASSTKDTFIMRTAHSHYLVEGPWSISFIDIPTFRIYDKEGLRSDQLKFGILIAAKRPFFIYNPSMSHNKVISCGIFPYYQFLILNHRAFLSGGENDEYIEKYITEYESLFRIISTKFKEDILKYKYEGWKLFLSNTDKILEVSPIFGKTIKISPSLKKTKEIASSYPMYSIKKYRNYYLFPIPHKYWSPDGNKLIFVGSLETPGIGNVYCYDTNTKKTEKLLDINDDSRQFNPDLEWTKYGIIVTCKDSIYYIDNNKKTVKLDLPSNAGDFRNGRISPDGKYIMFFGRMNNRATLFIKRIAGKRFMEVDLGSEDMENYQGAWINEGRRTIIKNEQDFYVIPHFYMVELEIWKKYIKKLSSVISDFKFDVEENKKKKSEEMN